MRQSKTIKNAGRQLGPYTIERAIGEGRYGLCFLARSDQGNKVVIKKAKHAGFYKRDMYEATILSHLKDKRIPEFLGVVNEKRFYGVVLEFKQGCTVKDMLFKHNHQFTDEEVFNIGLRLIRIVGYLHENGVVHRDIRIPNVLVNEGEVSLIDFGLARWADNNLNLYDLDFSYLGDFLLYIIYSTYHKKMMSKALPWYKELSLTHEKKLFLKKLLRLEAVYENINQIENDFINTFKI
jgi:serine/threonine-protein kinase